MSAVSLGLVLGLLYGSQHSSKPFRFLSFIFYWKIIASLCCVSFRCTRKRASYKYTHKPSLLSLLPAASLWSSQGPELSALCHAAAAHPLLSTWGCRSVLLSAPPTLCFPALCPQVRAPRPHLYSCPANRFVRKRKINIVY